MKKKSHTILLLLFYFLFMQPSLAQEQTALKNTVTVNTLTEMNPEGDIDNILTNFGNLNWEARKQRSPAILAQIEHLSSRPDKDLLLAKLYLMTHGENKQNLENAFTLIEHYLKKNPQSFQGYLLLATAQRDKMSLWTYFEDPSKWTDKEDINLRKQALQNIEKSIAINDKYPEAYRLKASLTEGDEKIQLLERAVTLNPSYNEGWRDLIDTLTNKKRYDEALKKLSLWSKHAHSKEYTIEIMLKAAHVFRDMKEFNEAIYFLKNALLSREKAGSDGLESLYSGVADIYSDLASTFLEVKDYKNAEVYFTKYLDLKPKAWYYRFELAKLYQDTRRPNQAIAQYEQVLAYDEDNASAMYNLALIYKDSDNDQNKEKAKNLFTKYIKLQIDNNDEDSLKWVSRAKENLNSLGVYEYPKSKKELNDQNIQKVKNFFLLGAICFIIYLAWRFKRITKWIILSAIIIAIVLISLNEAGTDQPSIGRALLYFIPVVSIGGFSSIHPQE